MGIPAFYRWLVERYPLAAEAVVEDDPPVLDTIKPNPNGVEFDNLYLDMNGIVHPCFHPEGLPAPTSYDDVFLAVFNYIDRVFSIVRPRKLLYLAIDGVAPRAKMNQQRSRRFRAAKDAAEETSEKERMLEADGGKSASLEQCKKLDSNVITPGTEFMVLLSSALRYYVHLRMNKDPGWRGIKVILSDANVPGEGEHKIMSYIRLQRNLPGYDPNTRHCLYGLDADLIMLAFATHEIHFSILREDVRGPSLNDKTLKRAKDSLSMNCQGGSGSSNQAEVVGKNLEDYIWTLKFQFLNIWVLREYLALDMKIEGLKQKADIERLIDDFVFMCLFVGNDFLPHIPSLEISEGAIDLLMMVYKKEFVNMGGYLTDSFKVNLERVEHFVQSVGSHECAIFRRRSQVMKERELRFHNFSSNKHTSSGPMNQNPPDASAVKSQIPSNCTSISTNIVEDKIKLGEDGWKERFYKEKFEAETEEDCETIRRHAVFKYIEGICWVMHYYYNGVCSWQWFYPYHYAPFASDFHGIGHLQIEFTLGKPFKPFNQLLGVLPAASAHALPLFYQKLMTDISSPLLDFYPTDFELDMNGKRFSWQAICKLPFIDESRLLSEIAKVEHTLTDEERRRNSFSVDVLFVHISHPLAVKILSFYERKAGHPKMLKAKVKQKIDPKFSGGMNGYIYISGEPVQPVEISSPIEDMEMISNNEVLSIFFKCPHFHPHIPRQTEGVKFPRKSVSKQDILPPPILWHEKSAVLGRIFSQRSIHKSISGHRLAKLAHELVSKWYHPKTQKAWGSMELADNIDADAGIPKNNVGLDKLSCHLKMEEMVCASTTEGIENNFDGKAKKQIRSKPNGHSTNCVTDVLECSKLEESVAVGGIGCDEVCITEKSKKRRRKGHKLRETLEKNVGADKVACPLNLRLTVAEMASKADKKSADKKFADDGFRSNHVVEAAIACGSEATDKNSTGDDKSRKRKRKVHELRDTLVKNVSTDKLSRPLNLGQIVSEAAIGVDKNSVDNGASDNCVDEALSGLTCGRVAPGEFESALTCGSVAPDKNSVDGEKSRKRGRKGHKLRETLEKNFSVDKLACPLSLGLTVCESGTEADKIFVDNGGANKLACPLNLAPTVSDVGAETNKNSVDNGSGDKLACLLSLGATVCEAGTQVDKNSISKGVPDNHVDEAATSDGVLDNHVGEAATRLTCVNVAPAIHCVGGNKSRKRRRKEHKLRDTLEKNGSIDKLACPMNLGPTVSESGSRADENFVDNGSADKLTCPLSLGPSVWEAGTGVNKSLADNGAAGKSACPLNFGSTVCDAGIQEDKRSVDNGVPGNHVCEAGTEENKNFVDNASADKLACPLNLGPAVGEAKADKNFINDGVPTNVGEAASGLARGSVASDKNCVGGNKSRKRRKEHKLKDTLEKNVSVDKLGCPLNLGIVCKAGSEADKNFVGTGVPDNHVGEAASRLACGNAAPDKKCVGDNKSRKRRRKMHELKDWEKNVSADKLSCPLNLRSTGCEAGTDAVKNSTDNGAP